MAHNRTVEDSTIVILSDSEDVIIMESKEKIPFLDLDPPTPKKAKIELSPKLKSTVQKVSGAAEDGEIVSSPESDAGGVEIIIHADRLSDDDSLNGKSPKDTQTKIKDEKKKSDVSKTSTHLKKDEPVSKQIGALVEMEDEVEIDHLEIHAPQQDIKKLKAKSRDSSKTNSPGKSKESRLISSGKISPVDLARKRAHEEENRRHSDNDLDEKKARSLKRAQDPEDLRKHLMMKIGSSAKDRDVKSKHSSRDRTTDRHKESSNRDRDRSQKDRSSSNSHNSSERKHKDEKLPKDKKEKPRKRDEKDRSNKKKKKRKHKESMDEEVNKEVQTSLQDERMSQEKSPKQTVVEEPSYDDISSPEAKRSPLPVAASISPRSPVSDSEPPTPPSSVENTPSRSPTPERSPTPVLKRTYFPAIEGCRSVEEFSWLNRIEEGTYGVVYRARDKRTDEIVALKRLKMEKEREGFPITSLREINTLLKSQHPNIVTVREIVVGNNMDKIYIVMDYVEHDLKSLMETMTNPFLIGEVKTLMIQLISGVRHMHDNWILHRDIKASNLLLSHKGILKIGDFGLAREYGSPLKKYTSLVVTLWYRAPELLLGQKQYSTPIDMWSVGCVFAELLTMKPLFPGKSEIDQINKIFKELGTPNDKIWPGPPAYSELPQVKKMNIPQHPYNNLRSRFGANFTDKGFDLMNQLLTYDPAKRITAEDSLKHNYFEESPLPVKPSMFPTWPAKSELGHKVKRNASPKAPEGGGQSLAQMGDGEGGFHMSGTTKGTSAKGQGFNLKF